MIHYVCRAIHRYTIKDFLLALPADYSGLISVLPYEEIFAARALPPTNLIFTDLDRLSQYELEIAASGAEALRQARPEAQILNHPARFLQRHDLLEWLWHEGLNPFRSARLELPLPTLTYPVFLRREGDANGPETGLLYNQDELAAAIAAIRAKGVPLRGRLVVEFCNKPDAAGLFRKYGAFRVADRILPQHLQISDNWVVKSNSKQVTEEHVQEEMEYIQSNPHRDEISRIMDLAGADFGRIDYSIVDGRMVVFEINSNPGFPGVDKNDPRQERRRTVRERLIEAFLSLDTPVAPGALVPLTLPYPRSHGLPAHQLAAPSAPRPPLSQPSVA
jgi:hypothetical protein